MKRLLLWLVSFAGLSALAWYLLQDRQDNNTIDEGRFRRFAIEDTSKVGTIFITTKDGKQALLSREGDGPWMYENKVTGKRFRANQVSATILLGTLSELRVRAPVSKKAIPTVVNRMGTHAKKVEIYDRDRELMKTYYVGGPAMGGEGTHFMMEGAEKPYILFLPRFTGVVDTRYIVKEEDWRDKALFRVDPDKLERVKITYNGETQRNFSFEMERQADEQFQVKAVVPETNKLPASQLNKDNVLAYLDDFNEVLAERILYDKPLRDSVITRKPFCVVEYQERGEPEQSFKLYAIFNPDADRGDGNPGYRSRIQRYYADVDEDNFFLIQHMVIKKILWGYPFFFSKEKVKISDSEG